MRVGVREAPNEARRVRRLASLFFHLIADDETDRDEHRGDREAKRPIRREVMACGRIHHPPLLRRPEARNSRMASDSEPLRQGREESFLGPPVPGPANTSVRNSSAAVDHLPLPKRVSHSRSDGTR